MEGSWNAVEGQWEARERLVEGSWRLAPLEDLADRVHELSVGRVHELLLQVTWQLRHELLRVGDRAAVHAPRVVKESDDLARGRPVDLAHA